MQMTGYVAVALPATAFGPGTAAVKFSADILPSYNLPEHYLSHLLGPHEYEQAYTDH